MFMIQGSFSFAYSLEWSVSERFDVIVHACVTMTIVLTWSEVKSINMEDSLDEVQGRFLIDKRNVM
jgi:hypothetical protein